MKNVLTLSSDISGSQRNHFKISIKWAGEEEESGRYTFASDACKAFADYKRNHIFVNNSVSLSRSHFAFITSFDVEETKCWCLVRSYEMPYHVWGKAWQRQITNIQPFNRSRVRATTADTWNTANMEMKQKNVEEEVQNTKSNNKTKCE